MGGAPTDEDVLLDGWRHAHSLVHCAQTAFRPRDVGDVSETVGPWRGRLMFVLHDDSVIIDE